MKDLKWAECEMTIQNDVAQLTCTRKALPSTEVSFSREVATVDVLGLWNKETSEEVGQQPML